MLNLQIETFRKNIYTILNNSELLIGTAYYVMKDVLRDLEKNYIDSLTEEEKNKNLYTNEKVMEINTSNELESFDEQNVTTYNLLEVNEEE